MRTRRPSRVYGVGQDPDPRFTLANERTFLAWVRTALALLAGSIALSSLGLPEHDVLRVALVILLAVLGFATVVVAGLRWAATERAMRLHEPLPSLLPGLVVVGAVGVVAVVLALTIGRS